MTLHDARPRTCDAASWTRSPRSPPYTWLSLVARKRPDRATRIPPLCNSNLIASVPDSMALSLRTKATCYSTTGTLK